jgi:NTP pyrophosphatase (non-canonical NTP hydrolase)
MSITPLGHIVVLDVLRRLLVMNFDTQSLRIKFFHAAPIKQAVTIKVNNRTVARGLRYRQATDYLPVSSGRANIKVSATDTGRLLLDENIRINGNKFIILSTDNKKLDLIVVEDNLPLYPGLKPQVGMPKSYPQFGQGKMPYRQTIVKKIVNEFNETVEVIVNEAGEIVEDVKDKMGNILIKAGNRIIKVVDQVGNVIEVVVNKTGRIIARVVDETGELVQGLAGKIGNMITTVVDGFGNFVEVVVDEFEDVVGWVVDEFGEMVGGVADDLEDISDAADLIGSQLQDQDGLMIPMSEFPMGETSMGVTPTLTRYHNGLRHHSSNRTIELSEDSPSVDIQLPNGSTLSVKIKS